jgi:threonine dehydratase
MWPLVSELLAGSLVASLEEVESALRLLAMRNHVIAEGAGAASVANATEGRAGHGKVVCIVSGGNINASKLAEILTAV